MYENFICGDFGYDSVIQFCSQRVYFLLQIPVERPEGKGSGVPVGWRGCNGFHLCALPDHSLAACNVKQQ